jgi:cation/acetate symporter
VWPGPDSEGSPVPLSNPALFSFPIGFLCCWFGTVMSRERSERAYHELQVRSETGIGAY